MLDTDPKPTLKWAAPILASLDIERTIEFYCSRLGFSRVYADQGVWGIVSRDCVLDENGNLITFAERRDVA